MDDATHMYLRLAREADGGGRFAIAYLVDGWVWELSRELSEDGHSDSVTAWPSPWTVADGSPAETAARRAAAAAVDPLVLTRPDGEPLRVRVTAETHPDYDGDVDGGVYVEWDDWNDVAVPYGEVAAAVLGAVAATAEDTVAKHLAWRGHDDHDAAVRTWNARVATLVSLNAQALEKGSANAIEHVTDEVAHLARNLAPRGWTVDRVDWNPERDVLATDVANLLYAAGPAAYAVAAVAVRADDPTLLRRLAASKVDLADVVAVATDPTDQDRAGTLAALADVAGPH